MNRILALSAPALLAASVTAHTQGAAEFERYIVTLAPGTGQPADVAANVARGFNGRVGYVYSSALQGFSISLPSAAAAARLANDPRIASVEPDLLMSINDAHTIPTGIDRSFASGLVDDVNTSTLLIDGFDDLRVDVDVAVLDTGADLEHPDLNIAGGANCLNSTGGPPWARSYVCTDGGGDDDHYHGTHVAGTIGAIDNGIGVVGVAPGARIWAVKVLNAQGSGYTSGIIAGIDWVVDRGDIEVINMSLGGPGVNSAYQTAIDNARINGVVTVVAAGNDASDANNYSPAFVPNAITVSALADFNGLPGGGAASTCRSDVDDTLANFSNYGSAVDIAAPGVCILSTYPIEQGSYGTISGTSMAAPHVAGAAAVLASAYAQPMDAADVDAIAGYLTATGNFNWTDESDDGTKEPLLDLTGYMAATVATGDPGDPPPPPPPGGDISLSVSTFKVKGVQHVDLTWSGASANVDITRDGAPVVTNTANDGEYTDNIGAKGGGSYVYQICETGTQTCSAQVVASF